MLRVQTRFRDSWMERNSRCGRPGRRRIGGSNLVPVLRNRWNEMNKRFKAAVAQMAEHSIRNGDVSGSIPLGGPNLEAMP
jgi:hypothetical protein